MPQTQAIGERCEYFARLERQPFARGRVAILRGIELDQLPREPREHQPRIADHRQQHLAQRLGLRRLEVVGGGRRWRQADVAEVLQLARQRAHAGTEMQLDFARFFGAAAKAACASSAAASTRVLGQRRDDDRGFACLLDGRARHAPARQRGGVRIDRCLEFGEQEWRLCTDSSGAAAATA